MAGHSKWVNIQHHLYLMHSGNHPGGATSAAFDVETAQKMIGLSALLDDLDEVQYVYSNADIADEILAQL